MSITSLYGKMYAGALAMDSSFQMQNMQQQKLALASQSANQIMNNLNTMNPLAGGNTFDQAAGGGPGSYNTMIQDIYQKERAMHLQALKAQMMFEVAQAMQESAYKLSQKESESRKTAMQNGAIFF